MKIERRKMIWWLAFGISTFSLSRVFAASRLLTAGAGQGNVFDLLFWMFVMVASFMVLGYDSYMNAKIEGKVTRSIWVFEKFYQLRRRERSQ